MKKLIFISLGLMLVFTAAQATHIKGGRITYEHISGSTYRIVLTAYTDKDSPTPFGGQSSIEFGDGHSETVNVEGSGQGTYVGGNTRKYEFTFTHTYAAQGNYLIKYQEYFRNTGILNMENSGNMAFYLETNIVVDNFIQNRGLIFQQDPIHTAQLGQTYHYNPKAFDPDGDSLSYHFSIPKQGEDMPVGGYTHPHQTFNREGGSETAENAYLVLDHRTGDLVWNAPVRAGEYNIALEVREWREIEGEYNMIGRVVQDFQIVVESGQVESLELIFPGERQEIYLDASSPWETTIRAIASNPEDTVILQLAGNFLLQSPELTPSDSVGGKGEVSISLAFTPSESALKKYQLIASAYIYSTEAGTGPFRSRAVDLLSPGYINGLTDLPIQNIKVYPNPTIDGQFYIDYPLLDGKEVKISIFSASGKRVYHKTIPSFSHETAVKTHLKVTGVYQVLIQEGMQLYTSRILFSK